MSQSFVPHWLIEQHRADRLLCLVLDSQNERDMRQRWLKSSRYEQYASVYGETVVAELADTGPFLFTFDQPDDRRLDALLDRPDSHWGWLASLGQGELKAWVRHWQERLLVGTRPHQALYRFHDNRVLARALEHLPVEALPAYLGPAISVCYWQGSHWQSTDNPAPGTNPLPDSPPWRFVWPMPTVFCWPSMWRPTPGWRARRTRTSGYASDWHRPKPGAGWRRSGWNFC